MANTERFEIHCDLSRINPAAAKTAAFIVLLVQLDLPTRLVPYSPSPRQLDAVFAKFGRALVRRRRRRCVVFRQCRWSIIFR